MHDLGTIKRMNMPKGDAPEFHIEVDELVTVRKLYTIEADNLEEAMRKAADGDTVGEINLRRAGGDVLHREVIGEA